MSDFGPFHRARLHEGYHGEVFVRILGPNPSTLDGAPFVGLRPFNVEDAPLFFGRGEQTAELLQRLHRTRFVAVVGSSGCGKSSLVRAGLIPALEGGFLVGDRDVWDIFTLKPGDRPLRNLAAELLSEEADPPEQLAERIRQSRVKAVLERLQPAIDQNRNVLLVVDQFEETFRFGLGGDEDNHDEAAIFTSILLALTKKPDLPIYVVLTMRSDFMADCDAFPGFAEAMNRSIYLVPRLTRQQRREAIEGPIRMMGTTIAPRLLDRLLNESDRASDQLPVLQHALMRTWEEWRKDEEDLAACQPSENGRKSSVAMEHYERAGTLSHALDKHAEEALDGLDRSLTRKIFQTLTDVDAANRQTRRPAKLSVLEAVTGAPRKAIVEILERFRSAGRSFVVWSGDPEKEDSLVDLSHESLIRRWGTLTQWVGEEAESASIYRRLEESTARYHHEQEGLWSDPQLQQALNWKAKHGIDDTWTAWAARVRPSELFRATSWERPSLSQVLGFLEKSRKVRDEERKRQERLAWMGKLKLAVAVAAGLALVAVGFAVYALSTRSDLRNVVLSSKLVRQAGEVATTDPQRSLLLAVEAYNLELQSADARRTKEAENALRSSLALAGGRGIGSDFFEIYSLAVSPDERWLFSVARNGAVRRWDLTADRPELDPHWPNPNSVADRNQDNRGTGDRLMHVAAARGRIATGGFDGSVRLDDRAQPLKGGGSSITAIAMDPDGRWLTAGDAEGDLWLWEFAGNEPREIPLRRPHVGRVFFAEINQDGRWLVTASLGNQEKGGQVALWSLRPRRAPLRMDNAYAGPISAVDLSFRNRLALGGGDGVVRLWQLGTEGAEEMWSGRNLPNPNMMSQARIVPIRAVAVHPSDDSVVVAGQDGMVSVWQEGVRQGDLTVEGERGLVTELRFSPDGRWLVAIYESGPVRLWSWPWRGPGSTRLLLLRGHSGQVRRGVFSRDGRRLFTGGSDGTIRLWDLTAPDPSNEAVVHSGGLGKSFFSVNISDDGRWLVAGSGGPPNQRRFLLRDLGGGVRTVPVNLGDVSAVDVSSDRSAPWVVTGHANGSAVRIWQLVLGGLAKTPFRILPGDDGFESPVEKVMIKNRKMIVAVRASGTVQVWRLTGGDDRPVRVGQAQSSLIALSSDDRWLAGVDDRSVAWIVDLKSPDLRRREIRSSCSVTQIALHKSGVVFLGCDDGTVESFVDEKTRTDQALAPRSFSGHRSAITSLVLSRDNGLLAAGGADGSTRVWSLAEKSEPSILPGAGAPVVQATFDQDNRTLLTVSVDGMVRRWALAEEDLRQQAEDLVGRNMYEDEWCKSFKETDLLPAQPYRATFENLPLLWLEGAKCVKSKTRS